MSNRSHGAARERFGLFSLENRASLFLAQVTCKRYSSLTCRDQQCCLFLAGQEASTGLMGAFGRDLRSGLPSLLHDTPKKGPLGGRA